jgi:hypothetical protein
MRAATSLDIPRSSSSHMAALSLSSRRSIPTPLIVKAGFEKAAVETAEADPASVDLDLQARLLAIAGLAPR